MEIPSGRLVIIAVCCGDCGFIFFRGNEVSLQVNFEDEARIKFLKLLGFSRDEVDKKVILPLKHDVDVASN